MRPSELSTTTDLNQTIRNILSSLSRARRPEDSPVTWTLVAERGGQEKPLVVICRGEGDPFCGGVRIFVRPLPPEASDMDVAQIVGLAGGDQELDSYTSPYALLSYGRQACGLTQIPGADFSIKKTNSHLKVEVTRPAETEEDTARLLKEVYDVLTTQTPRALSSK